MLVLCPHPCTHCPPRPPAPHPRCAPSAPHLPTSPSPGAPPHTATHTPHPTPLLPQAFKDGDVRFLICTDVAARGIDIQVGPVAGRRIRPALSHRAGYMAGCCQPARPP